MHLSSLSPFSPRGGGDVVQTINASSAAECSPWSVLQGEWRRVAVRSSLGAADRVSFLRGLHYVKFITHLINLLFSPSKQTLANTPIILQNILQLAINRYHSETNFFFFVVLKSLFYSFTSILMEYKTKVTQ